LAFRSVIPFFETLAEAQSVRRMRYLREENCRAATDINPKFEGMTQGAFGAALGSWLLVGTWHSE
jgi:hypothetical protein